MRRTGGLWPPRGPARVLVVTDDPQVRSAAARALAEGPHVTLAVPDVSAALAAIHRWRPHVLVVDADFIGIDVASGIAPPGPDGTRIPLVALTRRSDLPGRLSAFDAGADDVLTAPFPVEELRARVRALLRRSYAEAGLFALPLRLGSLEVDPVNRSVRAGGVPVHVTPLELSLLYLLVSHAGEPVTRDQILDTVWGMDTIPGSNVVERLVRSLRGRLGDEYRNPRYIATVPGRGYRLLLSPESDGTTVTGQVTSLAVAS